MKICDYKVPSLRRYEPKKVEQPFDWLFQDPGQPISDADVETRQSADIYALAIIAHEIVFQCGPFYTLGRVFRDNEHSYLRPS